MAERGQARRSTVQRETNIARRRVEQRITQRQAAQAAGLPYSTYQRLEAGDLSDPNISVVVNVALALRYPDEDLWDCLAVIWEDFWPPRPEYLTADDIGAAESGKTRLRIARDAAGRRQEDIAADLGVTARAFRALERGSQSPRLSLLARAATSLNVTLHEVCEERWLRWTTFPNVGATAPRDLDALRAAGTTLLPPKWA